jgi:hypothetical protein
VLTGVLVVLFLGGMLVATVVYLMWSASTPPPIS